MAPASFNKSYGGTHSANMEFPGTMLKSSHVIPSPLEEKFTRLPDSPRVFSSNTSISSTMYSLPPKYGDSFMANQHPYSVTQSTHLDGYANENHDVSWNEIENFLDTPLKVPNQDDQIKTSRGFLV